jgi:hypothetical protein
VRRRLIRPLAAAAVGLAAGGFLWSVPPAAIPASGLAGAAAMALPGTRVRGVLHIHTRRSDGSGTFDDVARAAARAALDFVVLSDHGDGTSPAEPPRYRSGVLVIDGVEISTAGGHVLALGLRAPPYRLAGAARDVVEDIHRFGGRAFAVHPDSPKPALAWTDWTVPMDGFEWLNGDSEWRDERWFTVAGALATYWLRGPESIAALFDRPSATLDRWDRLSVSGRTLVAVAGADAHARLRLQAEADDGETDEGGGLRLPSYEQVFRAASTHVLLDRPLSGEPADDAARIVAAVAGGRTYSTIDAYAHGGALDFSGVSNGRRIEMGERVAPGALSRLVVEARAPAGATLRLLRNGQQAAATSGLRLEHTVAPRKAGDRDAAAYRVEVLLGSGHPSAAPWMVGNPIWESAVATPAGGPAGDAAAGESGLAPMRVPLRDRFQSGALIVERDAESRGRLETIGGEDSALRLVYTMGSGRDSWVAAGLALDEGVRGRLLAGARLKVRLQSPEPLRMAVQLRAPSRRADLRWSQSVFVGPDGAEVDLPLEGFAPLTPEAAKASRDAVATLLLVLDRTHTRAGASGVLRIDEVALVAARSER